MATSKPRTDRHRPSSPGSAQPAPVTAEAWGGNESTAPQDIDQQVAATYDALRRLRNDIVSCRLRPGDRLRFAELRERYGVSMGTLREALSHLVSEGLVRTEAGRGFRVAPVSLADMLDIAEWRVEFEVRAVRDAIRHGDDAWEAGIAGAFHLLARHGTPAPDSSIDAWDEWSARHRRFHDSLVAACRSPWLLHFRGQVFEQAQRYRRLAALHTLGPRHKAEEHREIMEAVLSRNEALAAERVEAHIRQTVDTALRFVPGLAVLPATDKEAITRKAPPAR